MRGQQLKVGYTENACIFLLNVNHIKVINLNYMHKTIVCFSHWQKRNRRKINIFKSWKIILKLFWSFHNTIDLYGSTNAYVRSLFWYIAIAQHISMRRIARTDAVHYSWATQMFLQLDFLIHDMLLWNRGNVPAPEKAYSRGVPL